MRRTSSSWRAVSGVIAAVALAATAALAPAQVPTQAPAPLEGRALVAKLRQGGVTLYFRHVATDFSQNDERYVEGDCSTQRNLTDAGRADARRSAPRSSGCASRSARCARARSAARSRRRR
jgi:hypothetical protein